MSHKQKYVKIYRTFQKLSKNSCARESGWLENKWWEEILLSVYLSTYNWQSLPIQKWLRKQQFGKLVEL